MTKRRYFGTDGVRGPYGSATMNEEFAWRLGYGAARWLAGQGNTGRVLIGRDTRASGVPLGQALADGLAAGGCEPVLLGIVPTPAVALAVRRHGAALGAVITASHNPASDNGIKFFGASGIKLTDEDEAAIETMMAPQRTDAATRVPPSLAATADYVGAMRALLPGQPLAGWKVVLDAANGATVQTSGVVLRELGAELFAIGAQPDGRNINENVGSEHPEPLCAAVRSQGAKLGIAHDGDGDRCILCDERGELLDGDEILTILAVDALQRKQLPQNLLVTTVQSNLGVDAAIHAAGGRVARTAVGDRYVIERMRADGAQLGGESSGHIICADVSPTGDGLVAALKIISVMLATGRPLSELRGHLRKYPQGTDALKVREKKPFETLSALPTAIRDLENELGARGRVLVRYSGTEPKLRLLVEGPDDATVKNGLDRLIAATHQDLEVVD